MIKTLMRHVYFQEVGAGVVTSLMVTPLMTVIDTAVVRSQSKQRPITGALKETVTGFKSGMQPWRVPAAVMFCAYGATYTAHNVTNRLCADPAITMTSTSVVNIAAIAWKDREYARLWGTGFRCTRPFPRLSYILFCARDAMTVVSSFHLKDRAGEVLGQKYWGGAAGILAGVVAPVVAQLFSSPLHIIALDLYNRPQEDIASRLRQVRSHYIPVCTGRVIRVIPAFGFGSWLNDTLRPKYSYDSLVMRH